MGSFEWKTHQTAGKKARSAVIAYLGDCLFRAECPLDAETSRELAFTKVYFPELQQAIERVERIYSEQPAFAGQFFWLLLSRS